MTEAQKVIYSQSTTVTAQRTNAFNRALKIDECLIDNISDDLYNKIYPTRNIFQVSTDSYNDTDMQAKIDTLKQLICENNIPTSCIAINMMDLVQENNHDIEPIDLAIGMGEIIDFLLKKEPCK